MPRHSRTGSPGPTSKTPNHRLDSVSPHLPEFRQYVREKILGLYVHEDVLNLSQASEFYQNEAAVAGALTDYVECLPGSRYKLKNDFDAFFRDSLPVFLAGNPLQPADALADSFFRIARHWAETKHAAALLGNRRSVSKEAVDSE